MKKIVGFMLLAVVLVLGACSKDEETPSTQGSANDGEATSGYGSIDHGVEDKEVGFNMMGGTIEEAADVPAEEKTQILEVFNTYIDAFNAKDIDGYIDTLSEHTESFDKMQERADLEEAFSQFDIQREVSDVTIVKYDDSEAQVFSNLNTSMKQSSTGLEANPSGRQVTVLSKEEGKWKVSSIHYIGDDESK